MKAHLIKRLLMIMSTKCGITVVACLAMRLIPWLSIVPGVAILLTVLGSNVFGVGLREALETHLN
jgi:ABC-type dipeptide/oligopeptide/nickel transport system permease subunit